MDSYDGKPQAGPSFWRYDFDELRRVTAALGGSGTPWRPFVPHLRAGTTG
jgi:hypothetical protein